jgi:protein-S-isoprenylcysteine O-methyltransferase Ste14
MVRFAEDTASPQTSWKKTEEGEREFVSKSRDRSLTPGMPLKPSFRPRSSVEYVEPTINRQLTPGLGREHRPSMSMGDLLRPPAPSLWRHLLSVAVLPFNVAIAVPAMLMRLPLPWGAHPLFGVEGAAAKLLLVFIGAVCAMGGASLFLQCVRLFHRAGGTLAPWDPPVTFVARGPYAHVRNPMTMGVLLMLLGEGLLSGSWAVLSWTVNFAVLNAAYFKAKEEPDLRNRFGAAYDAYCRQVPGWWPTVTPWQGAEKDA